MSTAAQFIPGVAELGRKNQPGGYVGYGGGPYPFSATTLTLAPGVSSQPVSNSEITIDFPADRRIRWNAKGSDGFVRPFIGVQYNQANNSLAIGDCGDAFRSHVQLDSAWNTVIIGQNAANAGGGPVTAGQYFSDSVIIGAMSCNRLSAGNGNVAVGNRTMDTIEGIIHKQTCLGDSTWRKIVSGDGGTAVGYCAAQEIPVSDFDVFVGAYAGCYGNSSSKNTFLGAYAGAGSNVLNQTNLGSYNIGVGHAAMRMINACTNSIGIGVESLYVSTGTLNTSVGHKSLATMTSGTNNVALGAYAGQNATLGNYNVLIGVGAGSKTVPTAGTIGQHNIAIGNLACRATTAGFNIGIGSLALTSATEGSNIGIGYRSGEAITTGTNNVFLGANAGYTSSAQKVDATNSTAVGFSSYTTKSNQVVLGNSSVTETVLRGKVQWNPPASATPDDIGQMTFEATSNTEITVKLKGSDGTVRSAILTLS